MSRFLTWCAIVGAGTAGATILSQRLTTVDVRSVYEQLAKPRWAPPPQIFGPVWTVLYGLLTASTALVVAQEDNPMKTRHLALYAAQMGANALWTPLFFRWKRYHAAEIDAAVLTILVGLMSASYTARSRNAALMVLPVVAWCGFATALTRDIRLRQQLRP